MCVNMYLFTFKSIFYLYEYYSNPLFGLYRPGLFALYGFLVEICIKILLILLLGFLPSL